MNILRRELAPISTEGWGAIDAMAKKTLIANLSGRKFVDIDGPHGLNYDSVSIGRLSIKKPLLGGGVGYGIRQVLPLVETRVKFVLLTWELDNLARGSKDIHLDSLVDACREIAKFEDTALFDGLETASIVGLHQSVKGEPLQLSLEPDAITDALTEAQIRMIKDGVAGPAHLVVSAPLWKFLARGAPGGTLRTTIENQIGGQVLYSEDVKDALLVAGRGGDLTLTVGQDFAVGYHSHTTSEISLYLTESFAFRVVAPEALVRFTLR